MVFGAVTRNWSASGGDSNPFYGICVIVGALMQFFLLSGVFWTLCIAHTLFLILYKMDYNPERFEIYYHILCWVVPAVLDILLYFTDSLGDSGIWYLKF